ncbi:MAG: hypothetical protein ACLRXQ_02800 [Phascolarctobacterium faecium]
MRKGEQEKLESLAQELAACRECPLREAAQAPVGCLVIMTVRLFLWAKDLAAWRMTTLSLIGPSGQLLDNKWNKRRDHILDQCYQMSS